MKFAIFIIGALCFSQVALAEEGEEIQGRIGLNTVTCLFKTIDNTWKSAKNFPNAINACLGDIAGLPTDVQNMIKDLINKVNAVPVKIEAFRKASGFDNVSAAVQVISSVSDALTSADTVLQRVNAVVNNPQAKQCIVNSINNIKSSFTAVKKC